MEAGSTPSAAFLAAALRISYLAETAPRKPRTPTRWLGPMRTQAPESESLTLSSSSGVVGSLTTLARRGPSVPKVQEEVENSRSRMGS
ncbi:MAG: hypothetical protein DYG92_11835 [Leptolyngbya sp. PLA1]|nr:hypothetical protein [Leptolyngbya sp. PLA1]